MTVGLSMSAVRRQRGLTLAELSDLCGVDRDDLGRYERGDMTPRPETVQKIARALEVPIAAIRAGMGWTAQEALEDWERSGDDRLLREGIEADLRASYGEALSLSEGDIRALLESVKASIPALIDHMKDTRPEQEINREILASLGVEDGEEEQARRLALTDAQWEQVRPLLPPENTGRGRAFKSNRLMLDGILYQMKTGVSWNSLPERFGRPRCVSDRLRLWSGSGVWEGVLEKLTALGVLEDEEKG